ncbi:MAG: NfeD family protein [Acetivibrionales bacterium]|jgi:membrane protein implicated in regulation of membrane protease activity
MGELYVYTWLGLIVVLIAIEAATVSLTTIWLAGGALVALIFAMLQLPMWTQIAAFLATSVVLLIFTRPIAVKYFKSGIQRTNTDALIGTTGLVTTEISEHKAGQVKVKGQIWTAVSYSDTLIPADEEVVILAIEGVKLIVKPSKES